jgi:hypothetical protein
MPEAPNKAFPGLDNVKRAIFDSEKAMRLRGFDIEALASLADGDIESLSRLF